MRDKVLLFQDENDFEVTAVLDYRYVDILKRIAWVAIPEWSTLMPWDYAAKRFWRTIKYEEVYLHAYEGVGEARTSIENYIGFYNARRPHTALDGRTPDQAYFHPLPLRTAA